MAGSQGRAQGRGRAGTGSSRRGADGRSGGGLISRLLLTLLVLVLLGAAVAAYLVLVPYGSSAERFVDIPSGTGAVEMGEMLERGGVVRSRYAFDLLRLLHKRRLRAGEYRFDQPASALTVYERIARGDVYTRTVVIPEGYNIFDIARAWRRRGCCRRRSFWRRSGRRRRWWRTWCACRRRPLEGFLFPDTYRFSRHTSAATMLATMVRRFRQKTAGWGWGRAQGWSER